MNLMLRMIWCLRGFDVTRKVKSARTIWQALCALQLWSLLCYAEMKNPVGSGPEAPRRETSASGSRNAVLMMLMMPASRSDAADVDWGLGFLGQWAQVGPRTPRCGPVEYSISKLNDVVLLRCNAANRIAIKTGPAGHPGALSLSTWAQNKNSSNNNKSEEARRRSRAG